jgi:hypothetical protein
MQNTELERRIDERRPVDIYLNKYVSDHPFMVRSADISSTGIYLHRLIEPDLPEGSMVSLEFQLPDTEEVIWARGTVMREASRWGTAGVGVWFTILPGSYRRLIEDYVQQAA